MCQYSTELMSFTLDSLIVKDLQNGRRMFMFLYASIVGLIFVLGFCNNLCAFSTFLRQMPRKVGVGNYLLIISIVNQCSLLLLLLKVIHIIFGSDGTLFHYKSFNLYSCKILSYSLSVFTRITYWLTSFVTIERLCLVLFPTSVTLKNPLVAMTVSLFAILTIFIMHMHEILNYTTIVDPSYTSMTGTLCVTNYTQSSVLSYNRINVMVHYYIPFLTQFISITVLLVQVACSRARASNGRQQTFTDILKRQFKTQKEHYLTPAIIVLSSLPQTVLSFSYACTELIPWQRYSLLGTYFLSYLPQMLGFILYVLPSKIYYREFSQTVIGKRIVRQQRMRTTSQLNNTMKSQFTRKTLRTMMKS